MTALIYKDVWQDNADSDATDGTAVVVKVGECALALVSDEPIFKF